MNKTHFLYIIVILLISCATVPPPVPTLYIEDLPQSVTATLTLEERIVAEDAWDSLQIGRGDRAARTLARLGEGSPLYFVGLGYAYFLQERLLEAEQSFQAALVESPDLTLAYLGLAQLYQQVGQEDQAFNALREVLKREPGHPWARPEYEKLKEKKTRDTIAVAEMAQAQGDSARAKESYLKALHYSPDSVDAHLAIAEIYKREGLLSSALVHLKAAAAIDPRNKRLLEKYAETLADSKQYERSLEVYENLLELDKGSKRIQGKIENLKNQLGIYELPSRYHEIPLAISLTREDLAALLAVELRDYLGEPATQPPIIIDISTSWASKFILKVTSLGLLDVYSNHSFQPRKDVTRAELAEALFRVIQNLEEKGYRVIRQIPIEMIQVKDVSLENYYYPAILQILAYQVMELFPDMTFRPDQPLSGQEAIKIVDVLLALIAQPDFSAL